MITHCLLSELIASWDYLLIVNILFLVAILASGAVQAVRIPMLMSWIWICYLGVNATNCGLLSLTSQDWLNSWASLWAWDDASSRAAYTTSQEIWAVWPDTLIFVRLPNFCGFLWYCGYGREHMPQESDICESESCWIWYCEFDSRWLCCSYLPTIHADACIWDISIQRFKNRRLQKHCWILTLLQCSSTGCMQPEMENSQ